ncbi:MAG: hypothetical protein HUJ69_03655, partial [Lachnospiraceae bacterium]|nr:hypothetical protein [Lachnospiraceae bacterium]
MWMNKREQGSLTVFYAAVFSAAIGLMLALLSLGRARIMETQVRKDLDLAAFGVRAEYQKEWAREYGLYMIPESRLTGGFEFYLKETGIHPSGDYTYSDIFVVGEETLGDPNQLEKQITGLMEERGWLSLMEEVTELLKEAVEGAEATAEVSEATGGVAGSAALVDIQTVYASLVTDMEGLRNDGTREFYFVNGLLEEDPSYDDILLILQSMKTEAAAHETAVGEGEEPHKAFGSVSSHQLGELERTSQWMEEAQRLCLSAEGKMDALAEMVREIE